MNAVSTWGEYLCPIYADPDHVYALFTTNRLYFHHERLIYSYTRGGEQDHVRHRITERHQAVSDSHRPGLHRVAGPQPQRRAGRVLRRGRPDRLWHIHYTEP